MPRRRRSCPFRSAHPNVVKVYAVGQGVALERDTVPRRYLQDGFHIDIFGERCQAVGIRCSIGSVGERYDNAMTETFFATLECELLARQTFRTCMEARAALIEYIEVFYCSSRSAMPFIGDTLRW